MPTPITKIQGIGPFTAKALSEKGFRSLEDIAASDVAALSKVTGFGDIRASQTIASAVDYLSKNGKSSDSKVPAQKAKTEKKPAKTEDKVTKDKKKEKSKDKKSKKDGDKKSKKEKIKAKSDKDKKKKKKKKDK